MEYIDPQDVSKNINKAIVLDDESNDSREIVKLMSDKNISFKIVKTSFDIQNRDFGFEILKDKKKIDRTLIKTKMCTFGKTCPRGKNCRFAHDESELVKSNCVFGEACKFVNHVQNEYTNISKTKICKHRHPGETESNFHSRNRFVTPGGKISPVRI
jgi:hypothetical protein